MHLDPVLLFTLKYRNLLLLQNLFIEICILLNFILYLTLKPTLLKTEHTELHIAIYLQVSEIYYHTITRKGLLMLRERQFEISHPPLLNEVQ